MAWMGECRGESEVNKKAKWKD